MKAHYDQQPDKLTHDNDGTSVFRWNIQKEDEGWSCEEIRFSGDATPANIKRHIIRAKYNETEEFAIINKYNAVRLGILEDESAVQRYMDYLQFTFALDEIISGNE